MAIRDESNDLNWHAALDAYITHGPRVDSIEPPDEETARELKWYHFETACIEFAGSEKEGFAAVLRAVAHAMKDQGVLFHG